MKLSRRHILSLFALAALLTAMVATASLAAADRRMRTCEGLRVSFAPGPRFMSEGEVRSVLDKRCAPYIGQRLDSLQLYKIENVLNLQSSILRSEAWTTDDGYLNVRITHRVPLARFQKGDDGFYVDRDGVFFPLNASCSADVPVIDGNVPPGRDETTRGEWVRDVLNMLAFMDRGWAERIVQMHVDSRGDLILIPREGNERFIFGQPRGVEAKFSRMEDYYRYIRPTGKNYTSVNLKYDGQVICK
ncbi:MAG: cell division protein FtsQ/DivIB [Bacteroidia bacterium]|nr:cell division protein FtsQ/DivIB [Bacteroidia bacterium]